MYNKLIRKLLGKLNVAFALALAVLIVSELGVTSYVFAGNAASQEASTSKATTVSVVSKEADTAITTITFPVGAPSATVSVPYNDIDTVSSPQVLSGTASEPVVRLKNGSAGSLNVTLEITTWTNGIVSSEDYELVATTDTTIAAVGSALSADGNAASVSTAVTMTTGTYNALYLELVLSGVASKSGTSTLTILGETP